VERAYARSRTPVKAGFEEIALSGLDELSNILERLAPSLGEPEGEPVALEGGITNRNYRARLGGRDYVIRLPGKDTELLEIDRQAERAANQCAAAAGIAPPVAAMLADPPCLVTEFVEGEPLSAEELREPAALAAVATALRSVHSCRDTVPASFSAFRIVETYAETAIRRGAEVPAAYSEAHERSAAIEDAIRGPEHDPVFCHNDLLAANFLDTAEGLVIVDWEYAGMGDRYFDLGNFAVNNELGPGEEEALLDGYWGEPAAAHQLAALRLMRFMSDFREAMWGVVQGALSELDFDFGEYAEEHFGRLARTAADPSFEQWLEEASGAPA